MQENAFSLTRILTFKERIYDSVLYTGEYDSVLYTGEYGSVKTRILAYLMQCFPESFLKTVRSAFLTTLSQSFRISIVLNTIFFTGIQNLTIGTSISCSAKTKAVVVRYTIELLI